MAIDFTFTKAQRDLQVQSRKFARDVLAGAAACETLATPEERFVATKPIYEAMVAAGYLRKCIPAPAGGEGGGLVDMAILAEEFYSVNSSVTLTMLGTILGLLPILLGGDVCRRPCRLHWFGDRLRRRLDVSSRHSRRHFPLAGGRRRQAHGPTIP